MLCGGLSALIIGLQPLLTAVMALSLMGGGAEAADWFSSSPRS